MAKVTVTYVFEDKEGEGDNVDVAYQLKSDPPINPENLTEAQKASLWFAETVTKQIMQEAAEEEHCPEGHCCGGACKEEA